MTEHVTELGEIVEVNAPDARTPYQVAKSELAAFKFKMIETVAADPRLSTAPCAAAIVVLMSFVTIDKKTLKPTPAYASTITLMARGGMKPTAAKTARKLLEKHGYLVPTGSKTKDGCVKYRLSNPHEERVQMHVRDAIAYWKERAAEERKEERRKKALAASKPEVGSEYDPTQDGRGVAMPPDVGSEYDPNYLGENLSGYGSEGEDLPERSSTPSYGQDDDPHLPYPIPDTEQELVSMLEQFRSAGITPTVVGFFRKQLQEGKLTPAMVDEQLRIAS